MERMMHDIWCLLYLYYTGGNYRRAARKIAKRTKFPSLKDFCNNLQTCEEVAMGFARLEEAWDMWMER